MKSKTVGIVIVGIVVLVLLMTWGYGQSDNQNASVLDGSSTLNSGGAEALLVASEVFYDFGTISMKDGNVEKDFTITNPTVSDIKLKTVVTSCMCTEALLVRADGSTKGPFGMAGMGYVPPANEIIKAGESRIIRIAYDPNAHGPAGVGMIDRFVNLVDENGNEIQLEIKAMVKP